MPSFGVALAWIVISSLAFITNLISLLVILHYRSRYHSCDVAFISLFVTMTTNSWLLIPVPAVIKLGDFHWSKRLCTFYTWLSITLRSSHLLVLLVLNVYWMASLRMSPKGKMFISSMSMKASVCACWFVSIIAGLLPVAGGTDIFNFYVEDVCMFLPANVSIGFAVLFIIACLLSAVMGSISTLDTLFVLRSVKDITSMRFSAGRYRLATISSAGNPCSQIQYNELKVSTELCRLVLCFSTFSASLNGLPLLVSQFIQLIQHYDRETLEETLLWLLLIESLTLPHLLWLLSARYRHAFVYTWKVFVVRDKNAKEDDMAACTLQSYRMKIKDSHIHPQINSVVSHQTNGALHAAGGQDSCNEVTRVKDIVSGSRINGTGQGPSGITSDLDDGMTIFNSLTCSERVDLHEYKGQQKIHTQIREQNGTRSKLNTFSYRPVEIPPKIPTTSLPATKVDQSLERIDKNKLQPTFEVTSEGFHAPSPAPISQSCKEIVPISRSIFSKEDNSLSKNATIFPDNDIAIISKRLNYCVKNEVNILSGYDMFRNSSLRLRPLDFPTDSFLSTAILSGNPTNRSLEQIPLRHVHRSARIIGVYYDDTDTIRNPNLLINESLKESAVTSRTTITKGEESNNRKVVTQTNLVISVVDGTTSEHGSDIEETQEIHKNYSNSGTELLKKLNFHADEDMYRQSSFSQPRISADEKHYTQNREKIYRASSRPGTSLDFHKFNEVNGPGLIKKL